MRAKAINERTTRIATPLAVDDHAKRTTERVLVLNAGSSSLKFALFDGDAALALLSSGVIDRIGSIEATFTAKDIPGQTTKRVSISAPDHVHGLSHLLQHLAENTNLARLGAVGHRVVHGGPRYCDPQCVDAAMLTELQRIRSFAPHHLPASIALMDAFAAKFPHVPQIACFDTAFHAAMPPVAQLLPIPRRYAAKGVRRYGFHGLSFEFLMEELNRLAGPDAARGKIILAHLGNGASLAAVREGRSMDTTMAFTPSAGLMMSTRFGDLDPGLVSFLARTEQMTPTQFDHLVNRESGLLGVSGISSDLRDLLARESEDVRAAEAVAMFCYQVKKWIGAYAAALGGLDTLVFAGGIGENQSPIRARICEGLGFLGLQLDESHNAKHAAIISTDASRVTVRVIRTNEELMIARAVSRLLKPDALAKAIET